MDPNVPKLKSEIYMMHIISDILFTPEAEDVSRFKEKLLVARYEKRDC